MLGSTMSKVMSVSMPVISMMCLSSLAVYRGFRLVTMAPSDSVARYAITNWGQLGRWMPTRSPFRTPSVPRALVMRSICSLTCQKVISLP
ncbi:MAG: hypothetical protein BWX71_02535 [Deltaproteobacteria bacterium ADurb.Bin072]|nr:MAG: hypothetical protein BWX71_02535 [Deltaproteobacteria bacterium ADurb.Bin072]